MGGVLGGKRNRKLNYEVKYGSETAMVLLTVRTYWAPVKEKTLPPKVNVMTGREGILLQSTMYCNTETVQQ